MYFELKKNPNLDEVIQQFPLLFKANIAEKEVCLQEEKYWRQWIKFALDIKLPELFTLNFLIELNKELDKLRKRERPAVSCSSLEQFAGKCNTCLETQVQVIQPYQCIPKAAHTQCLPCFETWQKSQEQGTCPECRAKLKNIA